MSSTLNGLLGDGLNSETNHNTSYLSKKTTTYSNADLVVLPKFKRFLRRVDYYKDRDGNEIAKVKQMSEAPPQTISGYSSKMIVGSKPCDSTFFWQKSPEPSSEQRDTILDSKYDSWCSFDSKNLSKAEIRLLLLCMLHENAAYK